MNFTMTTNVPPSKLRAEQIPKFIVTHGLNLIITAPFDTNARIWARCDGLGAIFGTGLFVDYSTTSPR